MLAGTMIPNESLGKDAQSAIKIIQLGSEYKGFVYIIGREIEDTLIKEGFGQVYHIESEEERDDLLSSRDITIGRG